MTTHDVVINRLMGDPTQVEIETEFVSILSSKPGFKIFFTLLQRGATTTKELNRILPTSKRTVSRTLNKLRDMGVVKVPKKVDDRLLRHGNPGPKPYIWAMEDSTEEQVEAAWIRYRELFRKQKPKPETVQAPLDPEYRQLLPKAANIVRKTSPFPNRPSARECRKALMKLGVPADDAEHLISPLIKRITG